MVDLIAREAVAAFHGEPAAKAELLAALDQGRPTPLSAAAPASPETAAWAERTGLPVALVLVTAHLSRGGPGAGVTGRLPRELVAAIEPGARVAAAAHRLALWVWEQAPDPLSAMMISPEARAAGLEAVALHRRAAQGAIVDRVAWRGVRAGLGRLGQVVAGEAGRDDQALAATVMAACCWDYATTPGAAVDMLNAWEGLVSEQLRRAEGWSDIEDARFQQLVQAERTLALEALGPEPAGDEAAAAAHKQSLVQNLLERLNQTDDPLPARKAALNERIVAARAALRERSASALLEIVRALTPGAAS